MRIKPRRTNGEVRVKPKKCGRASHPTASFVDLSLMPSPHEVGRRRYRSDSAPLGVLLLPVRAAKSRFKEPLSRNLCSGQRPNPLLEQEVEEAAMPGQPARARAHFRLPPAIHPRELPAATSVTAIVVRQALRVPTFSLHPLCVRMLRPATEKHYARVNNLWRISLPCGRLRKSAEEISGKECSGWQRTNLDVVKGTPHESV